MKVGLLLFLLPAIIQGATVSHDLVSHFLDIQFNDQLIRIPSTLQMLFIRLPGTHELTEELIDPAFYYCNHPVAMFKSIIKHIQNKDLACTCDYCCSHPEKSNAGLEGALVSIPLWQRVQLNQLVRLANPECSWDDPTLYPISLCQLIIKWEHENLLLPVYPWQQINRTKMHSSIDYRLVMMAPKYVEMALNSDRLIPGLLRYLRHHALVRFIDYHWVPLGMTTDGRFFFSHRLFSMPTNLFNYLGTCDPANLPSMYLDVRNLLHKFRAACWCGAYVGPLGWKQISVVAYRESVAETPRIALRPMLTHFPLTVEEARNLTRNSFDLLNFVDACELVHAHIKRLMLPIDVKQVERVIAVRECLNDLAYNEGWRILRSAISGPGETAV